MRKESEKGKVKKVRENERIWEKKVSERSIMIKESEDGKLLQKVRRN